MSTGAFWVLILAIAAGTYAMRAIPMLAHGKTQMPQWARNLLKYVPAAALSVLVVPGAVYSKADGVYSASPERMLATLTALGVALWTKNMLATLIAGMLALWVLQAVL